LLKQPQYSPLPISLITISLFCVNSGFLDDVEVRNVLPFEAGMHAYIRAHNPDLIKRIEESKRLEQEDQGILAAAIEEYKRGSGFVIAADD
jgi:F-type H+-transporting ATPase subunit alpha